MNQKIIMAESSDILYDYRILKEAYSLTNKGFDIEIYGFSTDKNIKHTHPFKIHNYNILGRRLGFLRKIQIVLVIIRINLTILFQRANHYHSHNTYFLPSLFFASKFFNGSLIYDSHEVHFQGKYISALIERIFIKHINKIIVVSEGIACAMSNYYSIEKSKINILANYPSLREKTSPSPNFVHEINGRIKLIFSGGLNLKYNPIDNLIIAIKDIPEFSLDILGFGYKFSFEKLAILISKYKLEDRINLLPKVAPSEVIKVISSYDIAVNLLINEKDLIALNYCSTNKMYEYLAAGMPILCSGLPAYINDFVRNGVAFSVNPQSIDSIKCALMEILRSKEQLPKMRLQAFDLFVNYFNWEKQEDVLHNLYR